MTPSTYRAASWVLVAATLIVMLLPGIDGTWSVGAAQEAHGAGGDAFAAMLALAPDMVEIVEPERGPLFRYADLAGELDALDRERPESFDAPESRSWREGVDPLPTYWAEWGYRAIEAWPRLYGIDPFQIDQTLVVGNRPGAFVFLRGSFDWDAVRTSMSATGYDFYELDGREVGSIRGDFENDIRSEQGQYALNDLNFGARIANDVMVFTSNEAAMRNLFRVEDGTLPSLLDRTGVADLVGSLPERPVAAVLHHGRGLPAAGDLEIPPRETLAPLPTIDLALYAFSAGGPVRVLGRDATPEPVTDDARARFAVAVLFEDEVTAREAVSSLEARLEGMRYLDGGQPYSVLFPAGSVTALADTAVVRLDMVPTDWTIDVLTTLAVRPGWSLFLAW